MKKFFGFNVSILPLIFSEKDDWWYERRARSKNV